MHSKTIVFIGAGKVATHLACQLNVSPVSVIGVWSRTSDSAKKLAKKLNCSGSNKFQNLPKANIYIIAVKDDAIESVAQQLSKHINDQSLVVHTSGAVSSSILKPFFNYSGVFYPLQTFSEGIQPDFSTIPFCIFSTDTDSQNLLVELAKRISPIVHIVNDLQRSNLHLAAVFANNFTNYLQHISSEVLKSQQLPYSLIQPLMNETIRKLDVMSPKESQTGPAIRGDEQTMKKHLELLDEKPEWQEIYEILSKGIDSDLKK